MVLLPLGIALTIKLIPQEVLSECREKARSLEGKPVNKTAAAVVILIWLLLAAAAVALILRIT